MKRKNTIEVSPSVLAFLDSRTDTPEPMFSAWRLKIRGWSSVEIKTLLGSPDYLGHNAHYQRRYYAQERVLAIEATLETATGYPQIAG